MVTAYYPLPDLDPYYWMTKFQTQFSADNISSLKELRSSFSAVTYIFTEAAHIDFYAYFKYVLPAFFLFLIFPTALLAEKFSLPCKKLLFFLSLCQWYHLLSFLPSLFPKP
jgi:hypothetical protein